MAISHTHYRLLRELRDLGELPIAGNILEIGQANWYGDCSAEEFAPGERDMFAVVRKLYQWLMRPLAVVSIDLDQNAADALRLDLNEAQRGPHDAQFELTINHGTAEHIFNIANVFRLMHNATKPGGLMIHEAPFTGWLDHGFYCLQPTLFFDLAAANGYRVGLMAIEVLSTQSVIVVPSREAVYEMARAGNLPNNAMLFVALRKGVEESEFRVPMQGVYSADASEETRQAWRELR